MRDANVALNFHIKMYYVVIRVLTFFDVGNNFVCVRWHLDC